MDFYNLSLAIVAATISYIVYGKVVRVQENKTLASTSTSSSSCPSSTRHPTNFNPTASELNQTELQENKTFVSSPSPSAQNWEHHVFVSFRGEDVRSDFLSHILKEFRSKGINPFMDNEMKKGGSITPELKRAIKGSKIAIVVISKNYASSSWCLNELVKIIKCRRKIGQKMITIFYQVEPTDVKKQAGEFGKVFKKTCKGKTYDLIQKWREALVDVATIVGYDSTKWVDEASAIEEVANDISKLLNLLAPSHYLDPLIGMEAHMKEMQLLLRLDLVNEVRMIGIWGPPGIGKSTIYRYLFNQLSIGSSFQRTALMVNIKQSYPKPCLDEGSAQLKLQENMLSKMINQKDIEITHLGAAQDRLKDKKVLLVLDDVDEHAQLVALAENIQWFGPGSRVIITTENLRVLLTHGVMIDRIYKVKYPSSDEAFQMFCMYAFRQKVPDEGFTELAREVTYLAGNLPLGLQVMGSYFLRRPKHEWIEALPKLWSRLNGNIESILKFSYDALCGEYQDLFRHIACYFNRRRIEKVEAYLADSFMDVRQGLQVLAEKSLIYFERGFIRMHILLAQLGQEIVRKHFEKCQFLVGEDTCEVLADNTRITRSVVGIHYGYTNTPDELTISEAVFEGMSNLQFLAITNSTKSPFTLSLSGCLNGISSKLRLLHWDYLPITCWPTTVKLDFLVELNISYNNLEKLWKGIKPLQRLKWMNLSYSKNLRKLPNLSTATSLEELNPNRCSSLVEVPYSIGNAINLKTLDMRYCSSLVELPYSIGNSSNLKRLDLSYCSRLVKLPYSIGNATNLQSLYLEHCPSLVEIPYSIRNLHKLKRLLLQGCSKLEFLPTNIDMEKLDHLDLTDCFLLKSFPEISTNIRYLYLIGTDVKEVPSSIKSWSRLKKLCMPYSERLMDLSHAFDTITELDLTDSKEIQELGTWIKGCTRLSKLVLNGIRKLVSLPQLPDSILVLDVENCESLKRLDCSFCNPSICCNFKNCFKLNQEARYLIIQTSTCKTVILPGGEVPTYFNFRASGNSLTVKLNEKEPLDTSRTYRACVVLVSEGVWQEVTLHSCVASKNKETRFSRTYKGSKEESLLENLFIFDFKIEDVTSTELLFEFLVVSYVGSVSWKIKECGVIQRLKLHGYEDNESSDE